MTGRLGYTGDVHEPGPYWLGPVPISWVPQKIAWCFLTGSGTTPRAGVDAFYDGDIPWVTTGELREVVVTDTLKKVSEQAMAEYSALRIYPPGALVIAMYGATIGRLGVLGVPSTVNQACCVLYEPTSVLPDFAYFWLWAHRNDIASMGEGGGQPNISQELVRSLRIPAPSLKEQTRIVESLYRETNQLDIMVAEQKRLIELLWERRHAAVFSAVTGQEVRGPRREGVAWVDSIPDSWQAVKLLHKARLGTGHTPSRSRPELWIDCTIPWITTGEVWQVRSDEHEVITETRECISDRGVEESSAVLHPAGTVVLSRTASAGFSAIMGESMATSQDFATWTCGPELLPQYLLYCLRAMRKDLLERLAMGSTHQTIYMPEIKSITIPLPPIDEQYKIVSTLQSVFRLVDSTRAELETQTELLRERRQALVTAAVTGRLDRVGSAA
jgi:type I restriction enzyme S subunit